MNNERFDSMRRQMTPSPQARAALAERLAGSKRPVPWRRYGVLAACAVLAVGVLGASQSPSWDRVLQNFRPGILESPLHSYVTAEGPAGGVPEHFAVTGAGDTGAPNTGGLPGGAYAGDLPTQEEAAAAYQLLLERLDGQCPSWYGGAYIDSSGQLMVRLVEDEDPGDKSLELQVLDWTENGPVLFGSAKYSLAHLNGLMERLNELARTDPECGAVMAGWGVCERDGRVELTITQPDSHILSLLAELDPEDDAIHVRLGQRAAATEGSEDPAVHHVIQPGGVPVPEDGGLIAEEPYYDGGHYETERLPETLPEDKRPALEVQSVPEADGP